MVTENGHNPREGITVFELELRTARDACHSVDLPATFVLIGQGGTNVIEIEGAQAPFVVDAEGVVLRSGAVHVWCHAGCCRQIPQQWASIDAAADYHGSIIVEDGGRPRVPEP